MIGGAMVRGKVGAVWDVDVVPKLVSANQGHGCWSIIPIDPRIVMVKRLCVRRLEMQQRRRH